eukprot:gene15716-18672_t
MEKVLKKREIEEEEVGFDLITFLDWDQDTFIAWTKAFIGDKVATIFDDNRIDPEGFLELDDEGLEGMKIIKPAKRIILGLISKIKLSPAESQISVLPTPMKPKSMMYAKLDGGKMIALSAKSHSNVYSLEDRKNFEPLPSQDIGQKWLDECCAVLESLISVNIKPDSVVNEATKRVPILYILVTACRSINDERADQSKLRVGIETDISGFSLQGRADFVVELEDKGQGSGLLCITEAKRDDFLAGYKQLAGTMHSYLEKRHSMMGKEKEISIYGVVTNGVIWDFYLAHYLTSSAVCQDGTRPLFHLLKDHSKITTIKWT